MTIGPWDDVRQGQQQRAPKTCARPLDALPLIPLRDTLLHNRAKAYMGLRNYTAVRSSGFAACIAYPL